MENQVNPNDFWEKYESLIKSSKIIRKVESPKRCRFCGMIEPEVSFASVPHAVPELLGENNYIVGDECDRCNDTFAAYESHLAKFLGPYLTMSGVKGKRKVPTFESRTDNNDPATKTIVKVPSPDKREIWLDVMEDYQVDQVNKRMTMNFRVPPHKPDFVYRALVKIGLSILNTDLEDYRSAVNWLLKKGDSTIDFPIIFMSVLTRKKFGRPYVELFKAKQSILNNECFPDLVLVIGSGNMVMQVFLPMPDSFDPALMQTMNLSLDLFPGFVFDDNNNKTSVSIGQMDLSETKSITYDRKLNFTFQDGDFNIYPENL